MPRYVAPIVALLLSCILASSQPTEAQDEIRYYTLGIIELELDDVQRVWGSRLKSDRVRALANKNLLVPIFIDTDINVGPWVADSAALFVSGPGMAMTPLNSRLLEGGKGKYKEGDILGAPEVVGGVALDQGTVWFHVDSGGSLLVALDGPAMYAVIYVLE